MHSQHSIVEVDWLNKHLSDPDLVILDASLRKDKTGTRLEPNVKGIPGALYFNISDVFSDQNSPYPNMLVSPEVFEIEVRKLGINPEHKVVIYDTKGIYSSARAWWMFKLMGHKEVYVLNGGLPAWMAKNYRLENTKSQLQVSGNFKANPNWNLVWNYTQVKNNLISCTHQVVDARSAGRFNGESPEPRPNTRKGHIPESVNLHYDHLLNNGFLKSETEIKAIFNALKTGEKPMVFSCGSGITACILYLAAYMYLNQEITVYDGSWTEWGER